jgi:hypothetical protein
MDQTLFFYVLFKLDSLQASYRPPTSRIRDQIPPFRWVLRLGLISLLGRNYEEWAVRMMTRSFRQPFLLFLPSFSLLSFGFLILSIGITVPYLLLTCSLVIGLAIRGFT